MRITRTRSTILNPSDTRIADPAMQAGDMLLATADYAGGGRLSLVHKGLTSAPGGSEVLSIGPATGNVVWIPPPGTKQPEDAGYLEWNYDIEDATTALAGTPTAGTLYLRRIRFREARTITALSMIVGTAGATLTAGQCFAALFQGGLLLGTTVDQQTAWQSIGRKDMALQSTASVAKGDAWIGWWSNGTTQPKFSGKSSGTTSQANGRMTNAAPNDARAVNGNTGLTTAAPATLGAVTVGPANVATIWVGAY